MHNRKHNMCSVINLYQNMHSKYFNDDNKYVYGFADIYLIVYKKVFFTKTDEDKSVYNTQHAMYNANKLKVSLIVEKLNPHIKYTSICYSHFGEIITLRVGHTIKPRHLLQYYKSCIVAHYNALLYNHPNYTGQYITWYDCGRISSKGSYSNGQIVGDWKFWYYKKSCSSENTMSFTANYDSNNVNLL